MFEQFPKKRSALPEQYRKIYDEHYRSNRDGASNAAGLAQKLESWMHRKVAADGRPGKMTLEIGAGTLNHLTYESSPGRYDIVEPYKSLYKSSAGFNQVGKIYDDIGEIPQEMRYDRILSIATFEHICDLPHVAARCGLLLNKSGNLRVAVPSEGTLLWRLGYSLTTGVEFKSKYGLDYEVMMRHEHVNTAAEIEEVLRYFFAKVETSVFGVIRALSLYQFHDCSDPFTDRCELFLEQHSASPISFRA